MQEWLHVLYILLLLEKTYHFVSTNVTHNKEIKCLNYVLFYVLLDLIVLKLRMFAFVHHVKHQHAKDLTMT